MGKALVALGGWGGRIRVPFDGQRRARDMGVSPRGELRRWPLARFSKAICSFKGLRALGRVEMWSSVRGGHLFHGGKGIHVLFDGQRRTRGMDEPLVMSYDVGH